MMRERLSLHWKVLLTCSLSGDIHAEGEVIEGYVLDAFNARVEGNDAKRTGAGDKALRGQGGSDAAHRLADDVEVTHVAEVRLVDRVRAESLGQAEAEELRASVGGGVEAGQVGSALGSGVGIVEIVLIDEVVGGEIPPACIRVNARSRPCCRREFRSAMSGKTVGADVGLRDVLQQVHGRSRPDGLGNHAVGKDLRVRLAGCDGSAELVDSCCAR